MDAAIDASYVPTLNSAPTSTTTTYTRGSRTVNFCIGQFARVANAQATEGYVYYQLYELVTENNVTTATWKQIGNDASTTSSSVSGNVTVSGAVDVHFLTVTANVDSVAISPLPPAGKAITIIFTAAADKTVIIGHNSSARMCPNAEDLELTVPAGGYAEVSFLSDGSKVFVRGI